MSTVTAESSREHRVTLPVLARRKRRGEKISMLTAYDHTFACIFDVAGIDVLLVGDSLGNVVQGQDTTLPVTLDEVVYHTRLVSRGARRALVVADMPFGSYQISSEEAVRAAPSSGPSSASSRRRSRSWATSVSRRRPSTAWAGIACRAATRRAAPA
jgi:hypothetical protein